MFCCFCKKQAEQEEHNSLEAKLNLGTKPLKWNKRLLQTFLLTVCEEKIGGLENVPSLKIILRQLAREQSSVVQGFQ